MNATTGAAVIDLKRQRPNRRALIEAQGRWGSMNTTAGGPEGIDGPGGEAGQALRGWAEKIETSFIEIGQSLTRGETAASFLLTLDVFERTLQGLHAQGAIDHEQLGELTATLADLRKVPGLL